MEMRAILRLARLSPDSSVLEVGCGGGELLKTLAATSRAVGIDITTSGLAIAKKRGAVACAFAEALPFLDDTFDAVVAQHLIEHLGDPEGALTEWRRVLRPGGRLVIVTPNAAYPDPAHFEDPTHVHIFTPASLSKYLVRAGFAVDALFTLFPYLGSGRLARAASIRLAALARTVPGLRGKGRSIVAAAHIP